MESETNSPLTEEGSHGRRGLERRKQTEKAQLLGVCAARRARTEEIPGKSRKTLRRKIQHQASLVGQGLRRPQAPSAGVRAPFLVRILRSHWPCCGSVPKSCPALCDPMDCSAPGFPAPRRLLEFAQVHGHRVSDAIPSSHPLPPSSRSALTLSQHRGLFQSRLFTSGGQSTGAGHACPPK